MQDIINSSDSAITRIHSASHHFMPGSVFPGLPGGREWGKSDRHVLVPTVRHTSNGGVLQHADRL